MNIKRRAICGSRAGIAPRSMVFFVVGMCWAIMVPTGQAQRGTGGIGELEVEGHRAVEWGKPNSADWTGQWAERSATGTRLAARVFSSVSFVSRDEQQSNGKPMELLRESRRILFLGDSITYAGHYVAYFDAWLLTQKLPQVPVVIDGGLPSETVSGLSEEGHAGGRFPRPDLAERLDRVLAKAKPDLVFACYGINCGIYQPLDDQRFLRYRQGIENLRRHVEATGATLVLITPPFYDDQRAKKSFSYNAVLDHYAQWLLEQRAKGWRVVDLHGPMTREVARRRKVDSNFIFQRDGVHPNAEGHWFMARQLIGWFGDAAAAHAESPGKMLQQHGISEHALPLVAQRVNLLRDAILSAAGHKRPGIRAGLPLDQARRQAAQLTEKIQQLVNQVP